MKDWILEFIKAEEQGRGFSFIYEHEHEMSKSDLANILREYIYTVRENGVDVVNQVLSNIKEYCIFDDEE